MTQQKSSAARYREIRASRRAETLKTSEIFTVTTASGMEWQVVRPSIETYVVSGVLPHSMTEKIVKAMGDSGNASAAETDFLNALSPQEVLKSLVFAREIVRDICVNPRIVENPQTDEEIAPSEIDADDFRDLVQWAMKNAVGGDEAMRLSNFRGKS